MSSTQKVLKNLILDNTLKRNFFVSTSFSLLEYEKKIPAHYQEDFKEFKNIFNQKNPLQNEVEENFQSVLKKKCNEFGVHYDCPTNEVIRHAYIDLEKFFPEISEDHINKDSNDYEREKELALNHSLCRSGGRFCARGAMVCKKEVESLCDRDKKKHGNPHGPNPVDIINKYSPEEVKEKAKTTSSYYNERYNIK